MKKLFVFVVIACFICGCSRAETFETVADEMVLRVSAQPRQILLTLPEETLLPAMETDSGTLYLCDGYDVAVQTLESGDLDATVRCISGFGSDDLTIIKTQYDDCACYEFVWSAATELGEQVGRAKIIEDGGYHYALSATAPAKNSAEYQEIWNGIFDSFAIG